MNAGLGFPFQCDFKWILQSHQIVDCPVTFQDAEVAYKIWGPNIAVLKGKTMRKAPSAMVLNLVQIPNEIRDFHHNVTLSVDVFFINSIPFLITLSRNIQFTTVTHPADCRSHMIIKVL